jgi:hypothetical protein
MTVIRHSGKAICRVEPVPCDKDIHDGLAITMPIGSSYLTDEQVKEETLKWLLLYVDDSFLGRPNQYESPVPLRKAERLLSLILSKEESINLLGDLKEEYLVIAAGRGSAYANFWYWKQIVTSAGSLIYRTVRRALLSKVGK